MPEAIKQVELKYLVNGVKEPKISVANINQDKRVRIDPSSSIETTAITESDYFVTIAKNQDQYYINNYIKINRRT